MSLRVRALWSLAILAIIAACGQQATPTPAPQVRPLAKTPGPQRANVYHRPPPMSIDPNRAYFAIITTSKGEITISLDARAAPQTVNNFVFLANQGFYDGLTFHRVEPGFVIQGGDPLGSGRGGPGYTLPAEIRLRHTIGTIGMARLGDIANPNRDSSGSQFYITLAPAPQLDGEYTPFGQVIMGMDVVHRIAEGDVIQKIAINIQ